MSRSVVASRRVPKTMALGGVEMGKHIAAEALSADGYDHTGIAAGHDRHGEWQNHVGGGGVAHQVGKQDDEITKRQHHNQRRQA